jgi:hypothetical protein
MYEKTNIIDLRTHNNRAFPSKKEQCIEEITKHTVHFDHIKIYVGMGGGGGRIQEGRRKGS